MPTMRWIAAPALAAMLVAAGCAPGAGVNPSPFPDSASPSPTVGGQPPGTDAPAQAPSQTPGESAPGATSPLPADPWRTAELRDVRSGELLVVNDLVAAGQLVVIEPMAIWCTSCRAQQDAARDALASLPGDRIVFVSLDVDPNETEPDLARYADDRGYGWHFAVASIDVARSLAMSFGDQVLSPPSTPKIVLAPGASPEVSFGFKPTADLIAELSAGLP